MSKFKQRHLLNRFACTSCISYSGNLSGTLKHFVHAKCLKYQDKKLFNFFQKFLLLMVLKFSHKCAYATHPGIKNAIENLQMSANLKMIILNFVTFRNLSSSLFHLLAKLCPTTKTKQILALQQGLRYGIRVGAHCTQGVILTASRLRYNPR